MDRMDPPGREIPVSSWRELVDALHSREIVQVRSREGDHLRSPYLFRGMDDASWLLPTSLQRLLRDNPGHPQIIERSLIRSFRKYASAGAFDDKSEWYVLAVAQHNGLPTRCLDWTASPFVAAHFACADERFKETNGTIWCLNAAILRDINQRSNRLLGSLDGIAWVYDTRLLERSFADLEALDGSGSSGEAMLLWEPPSLDQRIANQFGLLSIMNSGESSQDAFLRRHVDAFPDLLLRIVIDQGAKSEIRDMLDQNNLSERTLFPGLPGLCGWLKRYYGRAWQSSSASV